MIWGHPYFRKPPYLPIIAFETAEAWENDDKSSKIIGFQILRQAQIGFQFSTRSQSWQVPDKLWLRNIYIYIYMDVVNYENSMGLR